MVWLHGGAFSYGSANSPRYDSTQSRQAQRRGGRRGQPSAERLRPSRPVGHRRRALRRSPAMPACSIWCWRWNGCATHAARFGGDPGNVTIFGQSGGGGKVSALLAMPQRQGPVPQGDRAERRQRALRRARAHGAARRRRAEASRPRARPARAAAGPAGRQAAEADRAGAEDAAAAALSPARPLQFRPGDRRQGAARASVRSRAPRSPTTCR